MSLVGTLARVGLSLMSQRGVGQSLAGQASGGGGAAGLLGAVGGLLGGQRSGGAGGAEAMLAGLLGGQGGGLGGSGGGLGTLLSSLSGGSSGGGGGLEQMLSGLVSGAAAQRMPLQGAAQGGGGASFAALLDQAFARHGEPEATPSPEQEVAAGLMLSAMLQAAKADGRIDAEEKARIFDKLGEVSQEEQAFVTAELEKPVDPDALAAEVPRGLEEPVYTLSLMAIDLDNAREAEHLSRLAERLGLSAERVRTIHDTLGVPPLPGT